MAQNLLPLSSGVEISRTNSKKMKLASYLALIGSMAFASAAAAVAGPILSHEEGLSSSESFTAPPLGKEVHTYLHSSAGVQANSHTGKTPGSTTNLGLHSNGLHSGGLNSSGLHSSGLHSGLHHGTQTGDSAPGHTILGSGLGRNHSRLVGNCTVANRRACMPDPIVDPPADDGPPDDLAGDPTPPPTPVLDPVSHDPPTGNLGESDAGGQSYSNSVTAGLHHVRHPPLPVPEPAPISLIGIGLAALLLARRRSLRIS